LGGIGFLVSSVLYVLQKYIIILLYGKTDANPVIAFFLFGFLIALPLQMMIGYFTIGLYSAKDTKSVFYSNGISTLIAILFCYMTQSLGNISLVYGIVAMAISNFLCILFLYTMRSPLR
jgi:Na+-driven multidrug efflux pump